MTLFMKPALTALALIVAGSAASISEARPRRWERDIQRSRPGQVVNLGEVIVGNGRRGESHSPIDVSRHAGCSLTHIMFTPNDSVWITRVRVTYAQPDFRGQYSDDIDLNNAPPPPPPGRHGRVRPMPVAPPGIQLQAGQPSEWLDLDDTLDGTASARCITGITISGLDTPDVRPGRFDNQGTVRVTGYTQARGGGHIGGGGRPPGGGITTFRYLDRTDLFSKSRYEIKTVPVGAGHGRFDKVRLTVKDDSLQVDYVRVYFLGGDFAELRGQDVVPGGILAEGRTVDFDFDGGRHRRGGRDQDRFIEKVEIRATSADIFGSKGRMEIEGGR